jgi:hypothetical protein
MIKRGKYDFIKRFYKIEDPEINWDKRICCKKESGKPEKTELRDGLLTG